MIFTKKETMKFMAFSQSPVFPAIFGNKMFVKQASDLPHCMYVTDL